MTTSTCLEPKMGALLHAYELRALSESDAAAFEMHLLTCDCCFAAIQSFEPYASLLSSDDAVRGEIRGSGADVSTRSMGSRLRGALWPDDVALFLRPAVFMVVILLLVYPAWRGLTTDTMPTIHTTQMISLMPTRSGTVDSFSLSLGQDGIIFFGYPGATPGRSYRVVISALNDSHAQYKTQVEFDANAAGHLLFPAKLMRPGAYQLEIDDPQAAARGDKQVYRFMVTP